MTAQEFNKKDIAIKVPHDFIFEEMHKRRAIGRKCIRVELGILTTGEAKWLQNNGYQVELKNRWYNLIPHYKITW